MRDEHSQDGVRVLGLYTYCTLSIDYINVCNLLLPPNALSGAHSSLGIDSCGHTQMDGILVRY